MKRLIILILIAVCASCGVETINCTNYLCEVDKVLGTQVRQYHNKSYYNATPIEKDITAILARGDNAWTSWHNLPNPRAGRQVSPKKGVRSPCNWKIISRWNCIQVEQKLWTR